jgi:DNA-directed RNA polymerase subunit RPC12/RpoP
MTSRDRRCVFVADDMAHATVVANWLETQGIPARVMDTMTLGGLEGLTGWTGVSARGIEVWVQRIEDVDEAAALIDEQAEFQHARDDLDTSSRPILVFCEACGSTTEFAAEQRGTTQRCPQCGARVTVIDEEPEDEEPLLGPTPSSRVFELRRLQKPIILCALGGIALYLCALLISALLAWWSGR